MTRPPKAEQSAAPAQVRQNVRTIADIEKAFLEGRTVGERYSHAIARAIGTLPFLVLNAVGYGVWILLNTGILPGVRPFDSFPFPLLTVILSLEVIFLTTFVLARQNRMSRRDEQRAHLDFQINLLTEQENTKMLTLLRAIAKRLDLPEAHDSDVQQLTQETRPDELLKELEQQLPGEHEQL